MTSETQHAPPGSRRSGAPVRDGGGTVRSGKTGEQASRSGSESATGWRHGSRARGDRRIVGVIPYLAVLVVVAAGLYIAWRLGCHRAIASPASRIGTGGLPAAHWAVYRWHGGTGRTVPAIPCGAVTVITAL